MSVDAEQGNSGPVYGDFGAIDIATLIEQVRIEVPRGTVTVRGTVEGLKAYPAVVYGVLLDLDRQTRMTFRCFPAVAPHLHEAVVLRGTLTAAKSKKHSGFDLQLCGGKVGQWKPDTLAAPAFNAPAPGRAQTPLERFISQGRIKSLILIGTGTGVRDATSLSGDLEKSLKTRVTTTGLDTLLSMIAEEAEKCDGLCLVRGGSDPDSFATWNDSRLIEALVTCGKPFYTALGHASDFTLTDKYADQSFISPAALGSACLKAWEVRASTEKKQKQLENAWREVRELKTGKETASASTFDRNMASLHSAIQELSRLPASVGREAAQSFGMAMKTSLQGELGRNLNTALQGPVTDLNRAIHQAQGAMNGITRRARFHSWTSLLAIFLAGVVLGGLGCFVGLSRVPGVLDRTPTVPLQLNPPSTALPAPGIERKKPRQARQAN